MSNFIEPDLSYATSQLDRQRSIETVYNKKQLKKFLKALFEPKLQEPLQELEQLKQSDPENYIKQSRLLDLALDILSIVHIQDKSTIYLKTVTQILVERDDVSNSFNEIITAVLLLVLEYKLIKMTLDSRQRPILHKQFKLSDEVMTIIHRYKYMPPMIIEPLPVNRKGNNKGDGHYTYNDNLLLGGMYHEKDICTEILDKLASTPLTINTKVLLKTDNNWKSLDTTDNLVIQTKNYQDTKKAFDYYQLGVAEISALMINQGNKFFIPWKYDKRGRIYSSGYHINPQGSSYNKATLEFHNKKEITEEVLFFTD